MKKIINGRKYDTATAREVAEWTGDFSRRDFRWVHEILYQKRTGEYFIYGEGGPESKYAVTYGDGGWQGGRRIVPLSYEAARSWAEESLSPDDYEAEFGEVEEAECDVALLVHVPASAKAALDREAARTGRTRASIVAELLASLGGAQKDESEE